MRALILNSGKGTRMGDITSKHPKCMTEISSNQTILSRQLNLLKEVGIKDVVITTGYFDDVLIDYCNSLNLDLNFKFIKNPSFDTTNYIYSMYCARESLDDDIILMHGDIVFEYEVLESILNFNGSCMKVSSTEDLPEKDFKSVISNGMVKAVGVEFFDNAMESQALYKFTKNDFQKWMKKIEEYCLRGDTSCYAEKALNEITDEIDLYAFDVKDLLCREIDTPDDLELVSKRVAEIDSRVVYMVFSTDMIHSGHIAIINKANRYGRVIAGILSDEVVASYKRFPLLTCEERMDLFRAISGVSEVVIQTELSYKANLLKYKPYYVVHGDDWIKGFQKPVREEVISVLNSYGGKLIEFPYSRNLKIDELEKKSSKELAMPHLRRARLRRLIEMKGLVTAIEAHSGITGLIAEKTFVEKDGKIKQFDAMWISSLCDSVSKGKPDIELVDMTSRFRTVDDILEVTTKPIIFDGDTGGLAEHFTYTVRTLERMGVSMVIIEDKSGLKRNSLFGTEVHQVQDSIENFCDKIRAGKNAQKTDDFMICARVESLILKMGMEDAITRARAYVEAGADAIMIHSREKSPDEIIEFLKIFRETDKSTPIVLVPTSYNEVYEDEFKAMGANVVIYANQLTRTGFPAMQNAARLILENNRAKECDDICMSIKEIITLIPEE